MAKGKYQRWLEPEGLVLLEGWARDGLTDDQLAKKMGIGARTLYEWKERYPQISQALKKGKEVIDTQVENALLRRALGYDAQEERVEVSEKDGRKVVQTLKHIPPDVGAACFWLKNRRPEKWRDKPAPEAPTPPDNNLFSRMEEALHELRTTEPEAASDPPVVEDPGPP